MKAEQKKGISLIVLVITIIVMIILAAAVILTLRSNNITNKANNAVSANNIQTAKEIVATAGVTWDTMSDEEQTAAVGETGTFVDYVKKEFAKAGIPTTGEGSFEVTEEGEVYAYPKIPRGFVASGYPGEDTVVNGLVIYQGTDPVTSSNRNSVMVSRNQFVWVPVSNMGDFKRIDGYAGGNASAIGTIQTFVSSGATSEPAVITNDPTGEYAEYNAMYESVSKYGGFFIARYEAGKEGTNTLVSVMEANVWNKVNWGNDFNSVGGTGAVALSRGMYTGHRDIVSHLIYGVEWDAAMRFIENSGYSTKFSDWATYSQIGTTGGRSTNNIYDLAGNVWEWTMEAYPSHNNRIFRGGAAGYNAGAAPASMRSEAQANGTSTWNDMGFRVALYLK